MISHADSEKPKKVVEFLLYMFPHIYSDDVYDLTFQVLPHGVFDTLFDLALQNTRELVAQSINPLLVSGTVCQDPNLSDEEMSSIFIEINKLAKSIGRTKGKSSRVSVRILE
jgi:hypothetical protein